MFMLRQEPGASQNTEKHKLGICLHELEVTCIFTGKHFSVRYPVSFINTSFIYRTYLRSYYLIWASVLYNSENFFWKMQRQNLVLANPSEFMMWGSETLRSPALYTCSIVSRNPQKRYTSLTCSSGCNSMKFQFKYLSSGNPAEFITWGSETARPPGMHTRSIAFRNSKKGPPRSHFFKNKLISSF